MALYSARYGPVLGPSTVSGRLTPLTVLGTSTVSSMALSSEWYGPVLGPSTVSGRLTPLTVLVPSTMSNIALYSEWHAPVLGRRTGTLLFLVGGRLLGSGPAPRAILQVRVSGGRSGNGFCLRTTKTIHCLWN